jgi:thiamine-monophosphate kinase
MKKYRISLIGGDISASEKVVLSATVAGHTEKYISRKGARAGDRIYVTGNIGDAACGLALMKKSRKRVAIELGRKQKFPLPWDIVSPLIERHLMPTARDPRRFKKDISAMIDISDGLMIDLSRLCRESRVGALVYADSIPMSKELKKAASHIGLDPLDLALNGGEDYELLFTAPAGKRVSGCCIGEIIKGGIFLINERGQKRRAPIKGYQHFKL